MQRRLSNGEWTERRLLGIGDDIVATNGDNRPKIAFGPASEVAISYTRPLAKPYTGEIRMLRSQDGGQNFSSTFTVNQDRQVITHRFDAIQFDARGDLYTFWIDKRDAEQARQGAKDDASTYDGAAIYYNIASDGGITVSEDRKLADYSCECCRISLIAESMEGVAVLWRHVFRNALIPLVTGFPAAFVGAFFTGSLLIETLFSLDGLGLLSYESVIRRDYPVVLGTLYLFTLIGLVTKLISDLCYVWVDPRVRFD